MTKKEVTIDLGELDIKAEDIQKIIDKKTQRKWKPYDEKYANDRFMITHTNYLVDTKTENVYLTVQAFLNFVNNDLLAKNYRLKEENEKLKEKNRRLEYKTVDMLDYIKEKGTITHQEMKEWWNTMMTGGDV